MLDNSKAIITYKMCHEKGNTVSYHADKGREMALCLRKEQAGANESY